MDRETVITILTNNRKEFERFEDDSVLTVVFSEKTFGQKIDQCYDIHFDYNDNVLVVDSYVWINDEINIPQAPITTEAFFKLIKRTFYDVFMELKQNSECMMEIENQLHDVKRLTPEDVKTIRSLEVEMIKLTSEEASLKYELLNMEDPTDLLLYNYIVEYIMLTKLLYNKEHHIFDNY